MTRTDFARIRVRGTDDASVPRAYAIRSASDESGEKIGYRMGGTCPVTSGQEDEYSAQLACLRERRAHQRALVKTETREGRREG
jgi:hypothetical protein